MSAPITRCPPGEGFGGKEPKIDPKALDRAGHWLDALYHASCAPNPHHATRTWDDGYDFVTETVRTRAALSLRAALRGMLGDDHAEFRAYYDRLVARTLTADEMHEAAGRLFTVAAMVQHIEAELAEDAASDTEPAPPMLEHPEPPELLVGG